MDGGNAAGNAGNAGRANQASPPRPPRPQPKQGCHGKEPAHTGPITQNPGGSTNPPVRSGKNTIGHGGHGGR
ncbi:hypothetical protein RchiOBHm_Chr7g0200521 [Rosa chinensis]|uniref:Uncharacterized protein n=1 Tax=Rosa chinensis TaxID=74649 RepID=A0A2P6P7P8_ROSCH|nr:hypothetical protein RchiOBHm_Chr7g0200521 [Rosa chinensis]